MVDFFFYFFEKKKIKSQKIKLANKHSRLSFLSKVARIAPETEKTKLHTSA